MNEVIEKINIKDMIYEIRGKYVIFAQDVAKLYNSETRTINQVVKRNLNRFPIDFCFQLTEDEMRQFCSRSQIVILNNTNSKRGSNIKYLPYVFTEHGVMMISSLLKNEQAAKINVLIIKAFVEMKKYISNNLIEQKYINNQVMRNTEDIFKNTEDIKLLQESIDTLSKNKEYDGIFFDGQVYDSYSLLIDIFNTAVNNIIIIDNYIDKKILDILRNIDKDILIITNKHNNEDYNKYKTQYSNIKLKINNKIHDRFIIIDNKELYHVGASLKDLGKKCFGINKIESEDWLNNLIKEIF